MFHDSILFLVQLLFFLELVTALVYCLFRFFLIHLQILFIGRFFPSSFILLLEICIFPKFCCSVLVSLFHDEDIPPMPCDPLQSIHV